jgi:hypothetical protein
MGFFYVMKYKDWSDFKIYCSRINTLNGQPKGFTALSKPQALKHELLSIKSELTEKEGKDLAFLQNKLNLYLNPPVLSVGAQNYLVEIYSRERYGIRRASSGGLAKAAQIKGFALEKEGVELLSKIDGVQYCKQTEIISDDYFLGVCDILCQEKGKLIEIKTSWNVANFMKNKKDNFKLPSEIWGQVQGYLHLYKLQKGQVCYVLVNTPPHLVEQEWANLFKRYSYGEITREKYDEGCYKLEGFFDYNKIPEKKRIIRFDISYSPAYISKSKTKVDMARVWLNEFEKRFMSVKNLQTNAELYLRSQEADTNEDDELPIV